VCVHLLRKLGHSGQSVGRSLCLGELLDIEDREAERQRIIVQLAPLDETIGSPDRITRL
jgi:hypothetical protein